MIAHSGEYGVVTGLSRQLGVSRQTLSTWCDQGLRALEQVFAPASLAASPSPALERAILTLLVAGHARDRGIHACLRVLPPQPVRLATIAGVVQEAERRALAWLSTEAPPSARPVALDELVGNDRHGG